MLKFKPKESKTGMKLEVDLRDEKGKVTHEVFIGTKTIVAWLGFTIGGILVGRSIWEYGIEYIGLELTTVAGVALFILTGTILHKFQRR